MGPLRPSVCLSIVQVPTFGRRGAHVKLSDMDDACWAEPRRAAGREFPKASYGFRSDLAAERVDVIQEALHAGPEEARQRVLTEETPI